MIPELRDIGAQRNVLPHGRYLTTLEELSERYVPADDSNRNAIWNAFMNVTDVVRSVYGSIAAIWFGGSFITSKPDPQDIDVVYLVKAENYIQATAGSQGQFVTQILLRKNPMVQRLDPLVDAYLLAVPPTEVDNNYNYSAARGYWDQFWSKARFADGDERWLYPTSGYLEVSIDGYNE